MDTIIFLIPSYGYCTRAGAWDIAFDACESQEQFDATLKLLDDLARRAELTGSASDFSTGFEARKVTAEQAAQLIPEWRGE